MLKKRRYLKFILFIPVIVAAFAAAVMLLWNALIPELFHGPVLSYWQALGLLVLSHILFRGGHPHHLRTEMWHRRMEERLAGMTPEERQKFHERWGFHRSRTEAEDVK